MQNMTEKKHPIVNNIHHMAKERFGFNMIFRDCNKCYIKRSTQCSLNEEHSQHNKLPNPYDLIKPCYVHLRRLNLWGHDGNKLSNCCPTVSETNNSKESVVNKRSDKSEHSNSITKKGSRNVSEENKDFIQKRMDLLFETLCQTFNLIKAKKAKKRKYADEKKVNCNVSFSYGAEKNRMRNDASTESIDGLYQGKNQSTNINIISYRSHFKNLEGKSDAKQNFKENIQQSYERNDNEIEIPSRKDINNIHIRGTSSDEIYLDHEKKYFKIRKIDPKSNCNVPLVNSTTNILSRYSGESKQDKMIQANLLQFPLKNNLYNVSNPKTKSNEKLENAFDRNNKVNIDIPEKHAVQKNLNTTTKNDLVDKELNEKSVCFSNLNIKNDVEADIVLIEDSDSEIEILDEYIVERNSNEVTKKYTDDKKNSHRSDSNKCVEDANTIGTNCNVPPNILKDVSNSNILQMETLNKQIKSCVHSANHSISFPKINNNPNGSTISEFTVNGEQVLNQGNKEIISLIKPCYVAVHKLPIHKNMELIDPIVMHSFCPEKASYSVVSDESRSLFEAKKVRQCNKSFCPSSNRFISSPKVDEIINIDDSVSAINETMNIDEIPNEDNVSAVNETIKVDEIPNVDDVSAINKTTKVFYKNKCLTILPCSVLLEDIRNRFCCKKCTKKRKKLLRQKRERKRKLLERYEYVRQWLLKIEEYNENPQLMENRNEIFFTNSNKVSVSQENRQICHTSDTLPEYPLDNFKIVDCYVSLERIDVDEYLIKNKNMSNQYDIKNPPENLVELRPDINKYKIDENFIFDSSCNELKGGSSSSVEDISVIHVEESSKINDCTTKKLLKNNETADNHSNIICHSDYKCVQCHMPISSDDELYHHLCCGKRKKGYICDFCEKIFITTHGLQKHMNYHYKFIS